MLALTSILIFAKMEVKVGPRGETHLIGVVRRCSHKKSGKLIRPVAFCVSCQLCGEQARRPSRSWKIRGGACFKFGAICHLGVAFESLIGC
jgi:hypothetical protein